MYTQCPQCLTIYEIDEDALQASLGIVRCGQCSERFDALRALSETLPADPQATLYDPAADHHELTLTSAVPASGRPARARREVVAPEPQPEAPSPAADDEDWVTRLNTDLAADLIADAAGIPREALPDDDWRLTGEAPVQTRFTELDIEPETPEPDATGDTEPPDFAAGERTDAVMPDDAGPDTAEAVVDPDEAAAPMAATALGAEAEARLEDTESVLDLDPPRNDGEPEVDEVPRDDEATAEAEAAITVADGDALDAAIVEDIAVVEDGEDTPSPPTEADDDDTREPAPVYVRPRRRWFAHAGWWWALASVLLLLVLAAQLAWIERAALLANAQARPFVEAACSHLPCQLPPVRDIDALELVSRDIRPDPNRPGALVITATIRNDARFRQPWPVITVELGDLDGNPVAMRRFRPAEYMPNPARRADGIAPGDTAAVAFEVADPGGRAVNFQFGFQ